MTQVVEPDTAPLAIADHPVHDGLAFLSDGRKHLRLQIRIQRI